MAALTTIFLFALFAGAVDAEVPTRSANGGSSSSIDWDMRLANKTVDLLETDPLLARSVQTPFQPEQIRLTLGGANEMRVTWITGEETVEWGDGHNLSGAF